MVCSLVILLAFTTYTTLEKGISQYKTETKSLIAKVAEENQAKIESEPLLATADVVDEDGAGDFEMKVIDPELERLVETERHTPWDQVNIIIALVVVVIIINYIKGGGKRFPSPIGIECGSTWYWGLTAAIFGWILFVAIWMRSILIEKWKIKKRLRYKYLEGDVEWNPINTIKYPLICVFAGFAAGLFGVGGKGSP